MHTRLLPLLASFVWLLCLPGCLISSELVAGSGTEVELTQSNYKYVHQNLRGTDTGFWLLGIIPLVSPSVVDAMEDVVGQAQLVQSGPRGLVHVTQESAYNYFLLFALPRITVRADVIEFTR